MNIELIDKKNKRVGQLEIDFDLLMTEADQMSGETFGKAVEIIKGLIQRKEDWQFEDGTEPLINKYLRKFAAFGYSKEPLVIKVKEGKGEQPVLDFTAHSFEEVVKLPNQRFQDRYDRLVGLDELKHHIEKEAALIVAPEMLREWSQKYHDIPIKALDAFGDRYPFFIFEGDVGTGKTEFAETFGNSLANFIRKNVILARMSMKSRGNGVVGEMSKIISKAFADAQALANQAKSPVILLLDEADSLAQSREEQQMHHEDRAGVNALIQGIDHIRNATEPILVVFCTNRVQAIDPAIKRRAGLIHAFTRPNMDQRYEVFRSYFHDLELNKIKLNLLARMTGENETRDYGFTYSDLITRIIPQAVLNAYPDKKLTFDIIVETIQAVKPTPPFKEE